MEDHHSYLPRRGDFIWLDLDPARGREQRKRRPVLVLSHELHHQYSGLAIVAPLTSRAKGYPFEIPVEAIDGVDDGVILADQVRSVDWRARRAEFIAAAPYELAAQVHAAVHELI